jgi:hypothetical protein
MRKIKFRAWDKEFKKFSQMALGYASSDVNDLTDYEWSQYTGLKDKNGKEVYEGDIVSVWRDGSNRIFTVKWREQGVPMYILYPQPLNENFWHLRSDMEMAWEVIGNIYENPELFSQCK